MCSIHLRLRPTRYEDFRRGGLVNRKRQLDTETKSARRPHRQIATKGQLGRSPLHDVPHRGDEYPAPCLRANARRCNIPALPLEPALRADLVCLAISLYAVKYSENAMEIVMRFTTIGILFTVIVIAVPAAAQPALSPTATVRKVVAATKLPTVTNVPLYFKVQSIALSSAETISGANSVLYQLSGSTEVSGVGETKRLTAGDGLLISAGTTAELKAVSGAPSVVLQFLLSTASDLDRPTATGPAAVKELYRTAGPIPDLKSGAYDLNLTQVTFPAGMPSNPPHHRSGAALYYIVSGTGANTVDGNTEAKGPGSLVYEPYGLVHQWGNPGNEPLTFVTFNINHEGVAAVLPGVPARTQ
jgi:quercetin dioxygenase-like cupin family protein